jgi:hypothetical protein
MRPNERCRVHCVPYVVPDVLMWRIVNDESVLRAGTYVLKTIGICEHCGKRFQKIRPWSRHKSPVSIRDNVALALIKQLAILKGDRAMLLKYRQQLTHSPDPTTAPERDLKIL